MAAQMRARVNSILGRQDVKQVTGPSLYYPWT